MGLADWVRVMRGHLTPEEVAERDAQAKARVAAAEQAERDRKEQQAQDAKASAARVAQYRERDRLIAERLAVVKQRTTKAAGVGSGTLVCHPDLLAFIKDRLKFSTDWHPPRAEAISQLDDGLIRVRLSGPQLACIVSYMADLGQVTGESGLRSGTEAERAIARRLYEGIALVVDRTQIAPGGTLPEILIDDRHPTS